MVFSNSSTKAGLVEDVDFVCGTDGTSYPLTDKTRNMNRHYYKAVIDMLKASGRVQYDDSNQTDLPKSTFDLVAGQQDYSLPTNLLKIQAIEVKNSNGDWIRLQEIDKSELAGTISDFDKTNGMPAYYDADGTSFYLYPAPATASVTASGGGKIHFAREVVAFASTDTTKEPGFAEPFHRLLSLGASYDYLVVNSTQDKSDRVLQQYEQLRTELRQFYGDENKDVQVRIRPVHRTQTYQ